jgi:hypothetical protein
MSAVKWLTGAGMIFSVVRQSCNMNEFKDPTAPPSSEIPTAPSPDVPTAVSDAGRRMLFHTEPFAQTPAQDDPAGSGERICAHDLFSFFTADIIRQKTIFTR